MAAELCRRQGCTCAARADGFCSAYCAGDTTGADGGIHVCECGHDECVPPSKHEDLEAITDLAPGGRFVKDPQPRDW